MDARNLRKRLRRLESALREGSDGTFSLEELCRAMWARAQGHFRKLARQHRLGLFVQRFQHEDADRNDSGRHRISEGQSR